MRTRARLAGWLLAAALSGLAAAPALAGRECTTVAPGAEAVTRGLALAERTRAALDASGARVVVLARAGQNLEAYGLRWSHLGFAYRATPDEPWRVLHKLNSCSAPTGDVYRQGLGNFFLDDPWRYEAAWSKLAPEVEARLLPILQDDARAAQWHVAAYSVVAHPRSTLYQQSNQWAIETLAAAWIHASDPTPRGLPVDRTEAQAWLVRQGYRPTTLRLGTLQRLGARLTAGNVAFDDHPNAERFAGRIDTVTADSVFAWLERSGLGSSAQFVR